MRVRCQTSQPIELAPGAGAQRNCSGVRPSTAELTSSGSRSNASLRRSAICMPPSDHMVRADAFGYAVDMDTVAFLVSKEGIEQAELTEPWAAVEKAGGRPQLISVSDGTVQGYHHLTPADTFR